MHGHHSGTTAITREQLQAEALNRAMHGQSTSNLDEIFKGFKAMGIAEVDILPRQNIFTFWAWKALGRKVCKGEHGVRVTTWIESRRQLRSNSNEQQSNAADTAEVASDAHTRSRFSLPVTVFHISQTEQVSGVPP